MKITILSVVKHLNLLWKNGSNQQPMPVILLRESGLPCIFYGDYYGISGEFAQQDFQEREIDKL